MSTKDRGNPAGSSPQIAELPEGQLEGQLASQLPHWSVVDGCLRRTYTTSGWKSTLMVVNAIGHLAESAWHHPDLVVSWKQVVVKLVTHSENAITVLDIELAQKIESFVQWQPATENNALPGTPADPRYAYIHYD